MQNVSYCYSYSDQVQVIPASSVSTSSSSPSLTSSPSNAAATTTTTTTAAATTVAATTTATVAATTAAMTSLKYWYCWSQKGNKDVQINNKTITSKSKTLMVPESSLTFANVTTIQQAFCSTR